MLICWRSTRSGQALNKCLRDFLTDLPDDSPSGVMVTYSVIISQDSSSSKAESTVIVTSHAAQLQQAPGLGLIAPQTKQPDTFPRTLSGLFAQRPPWFLSYSPFPVLNPQRLTENVYTLSLW